MSELTCLIHMSQKCLGCRKSLESRLEVAVQEFERIRMGCLSYTFDVKKACEEALAKMEGSK